MYQADTIYAVLGSHLYDTCKVNVKTSPKLSKKSITVKKNKTKTVKITGKASTVKNVYTNTMKAKIISKNTASEIKIKGLNRETQPIRYVSAEFMSEVFQKFENSFSK